MAVTIFGSQSSHKVAESCILGGVHKDTRRRPVGSTTKWFCVNRLEVSYRFQPDGGDWQQDCSPSCRRLEVQRVSKGECYAEEKQGLFTHRAFDRGGDHSDYRGDCHSQLAPGEDVGQRSLSGCALRDRKSVV